MDGNNSKHFVISSPLPTATAAALGLLLAVVIWGVLRGRRRSRGTRGSNYPPAAGTVFHQLYHVRRLHDYHTQLSRRHKTFRLLAPGRNHICTSDPAVVEHILKTNFDNYGKEFSDGLLAYIPYSNYIKPNNNKDAAANSPTLRIKEVGPRSLSAALDRLSARDERMTCAVYTILLPWVADVARAHWVSAMLCWIQPTTVLAIYYHYFHGYASVVATAAAAHAGTSTPSMLSAPFFIRLARPSTCPYME